MATSSDDIAQLEARNAAAKAKVDESLAQLRQQTQQLRESQQAAAQAAATLVSKDNLVTVTVDATGTLTQLKFAPGTFTRTTPETLARTVQQLTQRATAQVKQQINDLMSPLTQGLPDLGDLFQGAPSFKDLLPDLFADDKAPAPTPESDEESFDHQNPITQPVSPTEPPQGPPKSKPTTEQATPTEDEEPPASWLTGKGD